MAPRPRPARTAIAGGTPRDHQGGRENGGKRRGRPDRKINAARDDDQRHAQRDAGVDARLLQDIHQIALGQKAGRDEREHASDQQQPEQRAKVADVEAKGGKGMRKR